MGWDSWIRDGREIEPSLYAADFTRLGEQIDVLLAAGCRVFHFDVGDGAFRAAGDDRACRAAVDRADDPRGRRRGRLSSDGERPGAPLSRVRRVGCRLGDVPRRDDGRPDRGCSSGARPRTWGRRRLQARHDTGAGGHRRGVGRRRHDPLHEHRARLLGSGVHARAHSRASRSSPRSSTSRFRSTAASVRRTRRQSARRVRACSLPGTRSSPTRIPVPRTRGSAPPQHEPRARARPRRRGRSGRLPESDRRCSARRRRCDRGRGRHRGLWRPTR